MTAGSAAELLVPSKVFAVHLNYSSRAAERGRVPAQPSYFLKPPSSVTGDGPTVRPKGTELLAYEGEVAVVIGSRARSVSPQEAPAHIAGYAAANDFGLHDLRWADRGTNLLSKGQDGYTPIGPLITADHIDPRALRLVTTVNDQVRQDATGEELIFSFVQLVCDLSRFFTLQPGDVILTGTPTGTGIVQPGDVVTVTLTAPGGKVSTVTSTVAEASEPLAAHGAMPKATADAREYATGVKAPPQRPLSNDGVAALKLVSTATLSVQLNRRGLRSTFLTGLLPTRPDLRMVGYARTLRYVAIREDVRESLRREGEDAQKRAVESLRPDDVLVMEARNEVGCGTIGDILAARAVARGAAGIVTDGGVRDTPGVTELEIATYHRSANASSLWMSHIPLDIDVPITCAGVLVMPGDVLVGDAEGSIVLPAALAEEIAHDALEVERREEFALERVRAGESFRGIYPLSAEREPEYLAWREQRSEETIR